MTLNQLQYFCVLAEVMHYTRAAELLCISQPSLSYTISELEKELRAPLFEKTGKKIVLSPYGKIFLEYAEQALNLLKMGKSAVDKQLRSQRQLISLGYIHSISSSLIHPALDQFLAAVPPASIAFNHFISNSNNKLVKMLTREEIDLGFCLELTNELDGVPVFKQDMYILVSKKHTLSGREEIDFDDIRNESMVVVTTSNSLKKPIEELFQQFSAKINIAFEAGDLTVAITYLLMENCFTISPILPSVDFSHLSVMKLKNMDLWRPIYLAWKKETKLSESALLFRDFMCNNFHL